jgi:hypothetical protein
MIQYLYLNQLNEFTKGRLGPQQILHAASNGLIKLYAHTPELNDLASRISPISADDCAIIEREHNACVAAGDGNFSRCGFLMAGGITEAMCAETEPFAYVLEAWSRSIGGSRLAWEEVNDDGISHRVQFRLFGSDFIVFKDDVESLLKGSETEEIDPRERATFLRLVRFLCELQDIDISKHNKAYEVLAQMAANKGLTMPGSKNTIADKLKDARKPE